MREEVAYAIAFAPQRSVARTSPERGQAAPPGVSSGDAGARALVMEFHPHAERALTRFSLTDAQLVTARAYGFASWARLKQHLTEVEPLIWNAPPPPDPAEPVDVFVRLACMTYSDWHESNPERARRMLVEHSGLVDSQHLRRVSGG